MNSTLESFSEICYLKKVLPTCINTQCTMTQARFLFWTLTHRSSLFIHTAGLFNLSFTVSITTLSAWYLKCKLQNQPVISVNKPTMLMFMWTISVRDHSTYTLSSIINAIILFFTTFQLSENRKLDTQRSNGCFSEQMLLVSLSDCGCNVEKQSWCCVQSSV